MIENEPTAVRAENQSAGLLRFQGLPQPTTLPTMAILLVL